MEYYQDCAIKINQSNQTIILPKELIDIISLKVKILNS